MFMADWPTRLTPLDRLLARFTRLRPGEGRGVALFFLYALLMMSSYYILKTIREPLLLTGPSAAIKSYAYAAIAALLLIIVPLYGLAFRYGGKQQLTRWVTIFFLCNLAGFYLAGRAGLDIGFAWYVWVGVFSVLITAQFWAFAADSYNVRSGQRLFPLIMVGATLGGLLAPRLAGTLFPVTGPWLLMLLATGLLAATLPLVGRARRAIPPGSRGLAGPAEERPSGGAFGGMSLVLSDRYLLLLALLILLLNWVNTTGEYILAELVVRHVDAQVEAGAAVVKADFIAAFYGNFFFTVNLLTLLAQVFLVAHIFRWIGVGGAVMVLPLIALAGYGLVAFLPVFSLIRVVKVLENSTDYSLMNTTRHALYLPLSAAEKYEGKTTIEGFFWRFGDLLQAGVIYAGLNWFKYGIEEFAVFNMMLAAIWLVVAWELSRLHRRKELAVGIDRPPLLQHEPGERALPPGKSFAFELPTDTFVDPLPGDVLVYSLRSESAEGLPGWLHFDAETLAFSGTVPLGAGSATRVVLRATDFGGAWTEAVLVLRHDGAH
jgi:AAA family ATP:ADP antiporter